MVRDEAGPNATGVVPVFERLGISGKVWCQLVRQFGRLFYAVAGEAARDRRAAEPGRPAALQGEAPLRELLAA